MLKRHVIFICICLVASGKIQAQNNKIDSSEAVTLRIDPDQARGVAVSQIFSEVSFIPLETTPESLFGRISKLETTAETYIIFDYDTRSVLVFNKDGKYRTKLDAKKIPVDDKSDGFYGFELIEENNNPLIRIRSSKYYYDFDLSGKLSKKIALTPNQASYYFPNYTVGDSGTTVKFNQPINKGKESNEYELVLLNKDGVAVANYFPYIKAIKNKDLFPRFSNNIFNCGKTNELLYNGWSGDLNIYKITPSKLSLSYRIVLPEKNSLPHDFNQNPIYSGKKMDYLRANNSKYYQIGNTYKLGNHLFFNLFNVGAGRKSFLYDLKHNTLLSMQDLQPDQVSSFLPITDVIYDYYGFHLYKDGFLYNSYSSLSMFEYMKQSKHKNPKYSKIMEEYFLTQNTKSNPVIVQLKLKTN